MFPCQPSIPESIPLVSAEFSLPFSPIDTTMPPNEFLDLVHPDLEPSPPIIDPPPTPSIVAAPLPNMPIVRRSIRSHKPPIYLHDYHCNLAFTHVLASASLMPSHDSSFSDSPSILYPLSSSLSYAKLSTAHRASSVALIVAKEHISYAQALTNPLWQATMKVKIDALQANHTWVMTKPPPSKAPIGFQWVYKIKLKANGSIERYKAILVTKGFRQTEGIYFYETFSHVVKFVAVRTLLAIAIVTSHHLKKKKKKKKERIRLFWFPRAPHLSPLPITQSTPSFLSLAGHSHSCSPFLFLFQSTQHTYTHSSPSPSHWYSPRHHLYHFFRQNH